MEETAFYCSETNKTVDMRGKTWRARVGRAEQDLPRLIAPGQCGRQDHIATRFLVCDEIH
jgi:hypothetical protein